MLHDVMPLLTAAVRAAGLAGAAILEIYARDFAVEYKDDQSPLTEADRAAHHIIVEGLAQTGIPVLSEESAAVPYAERRNWPRMWLVDPLDGTKEFIKKNGEFTVNIALIENGQPIMGVVYAPALSDIYVGLPSHGAYHARCDPNRPMDIPSVEGCPQGGMGGPGWTRLENAPVALDVIRVVASRSHNTPETDTFIQRLKAKGHDVELISRGSALKLCLVAAGEAMLYPRLAPTMEWDTAAAQAVVEAAGGRVVVYDDMLDADFQKRGLPALREGSPLTYNREQLRNPWFVAIQ